MHTITTTISSSLFSTDALIRGLDDLPAAWALTPVRGNKAPYREGWQTEDPLTHPQLMQIIRNDDTCQGYGLRTGEASGGILAVDVDGQAAQQLLLELAGDAGIPDTVCFTSGKPGRCQYLFQIPADHWPGIRTRKIDTGVKDEHGKPQKLELRWNGLQSVLPPSVHPDTGQYYWIQSPLDTGVATCPPWLLVLVLEEIAQTPPKPFCSPSTPSFDYRYWSTVDWALSYLAALDPSRADDYDTWLAVGMALKSADESLLADWDTWSRQSAKYKPGECDRKWASFKRMGIGLGSLAHLAKQDGWTSPLRQHTPPTREQTKPRQTAPPTDHVRQRPEGQPSPDDHPTDGTPLPIGNVPDTAAPDVTFLQQALNYLYGDKPWISASGKLYYFTGTYYKHSPDALEIPRISSFCNTFAVADKKGRITFPYAKPGKVDEVLKWIKYRVMVNPDLLNPPGLNCTNGVLQLVWEKDTFTETLIPHDPSLYYTYEPLATYDPQADPTDCDRLLECLDPPQREIFLRVIGASLDLRMVRRKRGRMVRGLLLKGNGNNGKDALREVVRLMYGKQGVTSCDLMDFKAYDEGRKFPLSRLQLSRVNWSSENSCYSSLDKLQSIKKFLTGEPLSCESKGKDEWEFEPEAVGLFNINDIPHMRGTLEAIESRWSILCFSKTYKPNPDPAKGELLADPRFKYDPDFLQHSVLPAFLNRVLASLRALMAEGIDYEPTRQALQDIQRENSHLFQFCQDMGLEEQPGSILTAGSLWDLLEEWYEQTGTLSYEETSTGKQKAQWIDQVGKNDPNVKGANQVIARFLPLFPKAKRVTLPKSGGGKAQQGIMGIGFKKSPSPSPESVTQFGGEFTQASPTPSPTVSLLDKDFHPLHPDSEQPAEKKAAQSGYAASSAITTPEIKIKEQPLAASEPEHLGVVGEKSDDAGISLGEGVGDELGDEPQKVGDGTANDSTLTPLSSHNVWLCTLHPGAAVLFQHEEVSGWQPGHLHQIVKKEGIFVYAIVRKPVRRRGQWHDHDYRISREDWLRPSPA
ncbi:bifunctional DNA primase/polymerase [Aetokthonos hydrillicola Thurmond2011]|uniref:Bifunctional DNA primase/polymerase n=1 Tax=Aetokthonos hydrillicola Thurmond2011 TaxID=2712845 RepID=A0AAP5IFI1_9CYAN|nr:bifunctional DNA primase/polymerase [Aetokthonos hydrillicola]MBW4590099.1 bifunctional DNA primase/polymerase [Aetokthonos hydrillicola CCALA 1050]MDR9900670.1 bifunctional DNA primase/polymerase [Aetokthonos hydrillicola Thurmond2011]